MSKFALRAGPPLPDAEFRSRHRGLLYLLAAHLVALPIFGVCMGWPAWEALAVCAPAALFGLCAVPRRFGNTVRASACSLALLSCSAALVWLWHGTTEAHFHYFVMVGALALYEAALPYAIAFAFVVLQHGLMSVWVPDRVFAMAEMHDPWLWAGLDGGFVAALSLTQLVVWRASSKARAREQEASERALQVTGRFQRAFDSAPNGAALVDAQGIIRHANRALATSLRTTPKELVGRCWFDFLSDDDAIEARSAWSESLDGPEREFQVKRANGTRGWLLCKHLGLSDLGEGAEAILQTVDVSRRRAAEANLMHQASHDSLTGLLNRRSFSEQVKNELAVVEPGQTAVLFIDIDDFKVVNDSLGHGAGDELLVAIADRLRSVTRSTDLLGRFGGDEFVCCLTEVSSDTVEEAAARVAASLEAPFKLAGVERQVTVSIGLAMAGAGGSDSIDSLLRDADLAMYDAKLEGKDRTRWFDAQMRSEVIERRALEADLRHAIEHGEIVAHYQPQVDVRDGRVVGCEALARWPHPERGDVTPGTFIPLAERCGLIGLLTAHVLRLACTEAADWRREDPRFEELVVSVNLSPQAIDDELPNVIERILDETGMPARYVCLEVTETAVVDRAISHITLDRLKQIGVRLAIDDFGVGQSSLSQLARLGRLDRLKIDKALIDDICESATASRVTQAIIEVARGDGLDIVAEGVEHPEQLEHLRELSCPIIQGWLYSKALLPGDFVRYATAALSSGEWSAQPAALPGVTTTPR